MFLCPIVSQPRDNEILNSTSKLRPWWPTGHLSAVGFRRSGRALWCEHCGAVWYLVFCGIVWCSVVNIVVLCSMLFYSGGLWCAELFGVVYYLALWGSVV